jgi:hypothetical protein
LPVLLKESEANTRERQIPIYNLRRYFGFFIVSGFFGLVYEVVWLRLVMASFGITTALVSIVISMFMAGLGLGSCAGVLTRRILAADRSRALRFYSIAESIVGISSLAVPLQLKLGRLLLQHMGSFGAWQTSRHYLLTGPWIARYRWRHCSLRIRGLRLCGMTSPSTSITSCADGSIPTDS